MCRLGLIGALLMTFAACSRDPATRTREYIASGDAFARAGKYREASVEYRNAIKITPTSAEAHEKLADAAARAQDPQTAAGAILRLADLKPTDPVAQIRAASLLLLAGRYEDARDRAMMAVESDGDDANAHLLLAQALAALHDATRSENELREAVRLAPDAPEPLVALGSFHWAAGKTADAEAELRKAVALDPQHVAANQALALFFMATGRPADAEPLWRVVSASPKGLPFALVDYLVATNRLADAERALGDLIAREATRDAASMRLAAVQYARGQREKAHVTVRALLQRNPRSVPALLLQARFFRAEQRLDEALRATQAAADADPKNAGAGTMAGLTLEALNRRDEAQRAFERALEANPRAGVAANNLAWIYQEQGRLDDALRWALVAKDELRNMPEAKDTLGWIRMRREEYGDALPLLSAIVEARPDNALYRYHLGYAYWKTGATMRAQEQLQRALASKNSFAARADAERVLGEIEANAHNASR